MPINKKYKKKQSQKHSVSELINPSKTKKTINLQIQVFLINILKMLIKIKKIK
jgi:hypothetical protein